MLATGHRSSGPPHDQENTEGLEACARAVDTASAMPLPSLGAKTSSSFAGWPVDQDQAAAATRMSSMTSPSASGCTPGLFLAPRTDTSVICGAGSFSLAK